MGKDIKRYLDPIIKKKGRHHNTKVIITRIVLYSLAAVFLFAIFLSLTNYQGGNTNDTVTYRCLDGSIQVVNKSKINDDIVICGRPNPRYVYQANKNDYNINITND